MSEGIRTVYALVEGTESEAWIIEGPDAAGLFVRVAVAGETDNCLLAIGLSRSYEVVGCTVLARNGARADRMPTMRVLAAVREMGAPRFILARTRFAGDPCPSVTETRIARMIGLGAGIAGPRMVDHIVVGGRGLYWSAWVEDAVDWVATREITTR